MEKKCEYDDNWIEIDRQAHYHTIQNKNPLINAHVAQFGPPRSGTTVVFQLLCSLFDKTTKTHSEAGVMSFIPDAYFCTCRDPRDVIVSFWRVNANINKDNARNATIGELDYFCDIYKDHFRQMVSYQSLPNVVWLKYENYYNDFDYVFDKIENKFEKKIPEHTRNKLKDIHGLDRNKKISDELKTFDNHQHDSGIHGNHIFTGEPGTWKTFVDSVGENLLNERLGEYLSNWNYK